MDIIAAFKRFYLGMIGMGFFIGGILLLAIKEKCFLVWMGDGCNKRYYKLDNKT
tara:strand:+ start:506 stop:667 length:162 start_codon:yes stop_codon:yes gene_type:complete